VRQILPFLAVGILVIATAGAVALGIAQSQTFDLSAPCLLVSATQVAEVLGHPVKSERAAIEGFPECRFHGTASQSVATITVTSAPKGVKLGSVNLAQYGEPVTDMGMWQTTAYLGADHLGIAIAADRYDVIVISVSGKTHRRQRAMELMSQVFQPT
jgi:hypothetical protein